MGDAGLYYYYHTFAKALDAMGQDTVEDEQGVKHDWRRDLLAELVKRQQPDGSWVNDEPPLAGEQPEPGHRLRPAGADLLPAGGAEVACVSTHHGHTSALPVVLDPDTLHRIARASLARFMVRPDAPGTLGTVFPAELGSVVTAYHRSRGQARLEWDTVGRWSVW